MKNQKKQSLKKMVKKVQSEISKSPIPDSEVHTTDRPVKDLSSVKKPKIKNKKPKGDESHGEVNKEKEKQGTPGFPPPGPEEQNRGGRGGENGEGEKGFFPWDF